MKIKNITGIALAALAFGTMPARAQYVTDALRVSQQNNASTARTKALGGAQYSLGADISTVGANPAGVGMFTSSDASLTLGVVNSANTGSFYGSSTKANDTKFVLGQAGGVLNMPTTRYLGQRTDKGLLAVNFGLNFNTTANYNNTFEFSGTNNESSFTGFFTQLANTSGAHIPETLASADPLAYAAYQGYLLDYSNTSAKWVQAGRPGNIQHNRDVQKGYQNEVNAALGLNFSNKFYIGGSVALTSFDLEKDRVFSEDGVDNFNKAYNAAFSEHTVTKGSGVNGKIGIIYRPVNEFRFGITYQTPTWWAVNDDYQQQLSNPGSKYVSQIQPYSNDFNMVTPGKVTGSVTLLNSKIGLITADVDLINYKDIDIETSDGYDSNDNRSVDNLYRSAVNFRVGAEARVNNNFSLRAGFAKDGTPYSNTSVKDFGRTNVSGGIGYRNKAFYADLAYVNTAYKFNNYNAYTYDNASGVSQNVNGNLKNNTNTVMLTVGVKF